MIPAVVRTAVYLACFVGSFLGVTLILRHPSTEPPVPVVTEKLARLRAAGARFDTLFIGSSLVRRQISPQVFDARLRELGVESHSFNLGVDGMTFPELSYFLDRVLESKPPGLRRVFFDLNNLRRKLDPAMDQRSLRAIYWHDWRHTKKVCRAVLDDPDPVRRSRAENLALLFSHLQLMVSHYSVVGRGAVFLQSRLERRKKPQADPAAVPDLGPDGDGFFPVTGSLAGDAAERFRKALGEMQALANRPHRQDPATDEALAELTAKVDRAGVRAFFLVSPIINVVRPVLPPAGVILDFEDPAAFPNLYDPSRRYNLQHLNVIGAAEYSAAIAERVGALPSEKTP